jgi:glutamyl-tRNA synthetase
LAPTPSGFLHYGNLFNFVLTWRAVRSARGVLALRIDDLDATRARDVYLEDIFETLHWLGFDWDEGPRDVAQFKSQFSQTLRTENYRAFLKKFPGYACACSRSQVKARTDKLYDGFCRKRELALITDQTQWRFRADIPEHDVVLWQKHGLPAYHLVSLYEDLQDHTTLIVRGEDLRESSELQKLLALALGAEGRAFSEIQFVHHPLILERGVKLSKSAGALSLQSERELGKKASEVFLRLSELTGKPPITSLAESLRLW